MKIRLSKKSKITTNLQSGIKIGWHKNNGTNILTKLCHGQKAWYWKIYNADEIQVWTFRGLYVKKTGLNTVYCKVCGHWIGISLERKKQLGDVLTFKT
jgi:hypothetical protein